MLTSLLADKLISHGKYNNLRFMNKHVSSPCNSSLAMSFIIENNGTTEEEVGVTSHFGGNVASDE